MVEQLPTAAFHGDETTSYLSNWCSKRLRMVETLWLGLGIDLHRSYRVQVLVNTYSTGKRKNTKIQKKQNAGIWQTSTVSPSIAAGC